MRFLVKLDNKIDKDEALRVLDDYAEFIEDNTGIECEFYVERHDFSFVPTTPDEDGDLKPTYKYRQALAKEVHDRYGDYGCDNILMWVHEDNFLFKGVWGTAWSYTHFKYNLLLCRWDKDNEVNTFNTLFHEGEHPHDTVILKELGIEVNGLLAAKFEKDNFDYDKDYVHGGSKHFKYIGERGYTKDGTMLSFLSPYIRQAYAKRKEKHFAPVKAVMWEIINFLTRLIHK